MLIRRMTKDDWERICEIYEQGIESGIATFQQEVPCYEEWDRNHLQECRYVAIEDERVVGFVVLSPTSTRMVYKGVVEVSIYIDEAYRNKGIGYQLLDHLCKEAAKQGFWSLLSVIIEDNVASRLLHKKCGFREIGFREKIAKNKDGKWKDSIMMEKRSDQIY